MVEFEYTNNVPYFEKYIDEEGFHLDRLIDDDFLRALKLLWQNGYYTSALKLLLSFVDAMAFLENGTTNGLLYKLWLDKYVDLTPLEITSSEVWEHRNALLHMTTYSSNKVLKGKVRQLAPYVANGVSIEGSLKSVIDDETIAKNYDLHTFILAVLQGVDNFIEEQNKNTSSWKNFFENYDELVSDSRRLTVFPAEV